MDSHFSFQFLPLKSKCINRDWIHIYLLNYLCKPNPLHEKSNPLTYIHALETEIYRMVYKLYGLTPEDIKILEDENEDAD